MAKIGIIGIGHVGSHVASAILQQGLCNELVLIDKDEKKAIAHGYDLIDASLYYPNDVKFIYNDYSALKDADIVVISVAGSIVCESRLKETESSIASVAEVVPLLVASGFNGIVLSITNPCDIVANYIAKKTNLNVIGSGTTLDSARLKKLIALDLNVNPNVVDAYMLGEHGDSQFPYLSQAKVAGKGILAYQAQINLEEIIHNVRFRAVPIFNSKGCTEFGIGTCAAKIINAILNDTREVLPLSYYVNDYGIENTYVSIPRIIGKNGVEKTLEIELNNEEQTKLLDCAKIIEQRLAPFLK